MWTTGRGHPGAPPAAHRTAPPVAVAGRLLVVLLLLLGITLGLGYLLTRADQGDAFERADRALVRGLAGARTGILDAVSGPAGELGNTGVVIALAAITAVVAGLLHRSWRPAAVLAVALCGELVIFLMTTALIDRPRPPVPHLDAQLPPTSSFPSGHTAAAICLYGALAAIVLAGARNRWRRPVILGAVGIVAVVAGARLYRGAHYPTDLLASVLFALPWLLVTLRAIPLRGAAIPNGMGEWRGD